MRALATQHNPFDQMPEDPASLKSNVPFFYFALSQDINDLATNVKTIQVRLAFAGSILDSAGNSLLVTSNVFLKARRYIDADSGITFRGYTEGNETKLGSFELDLSSIKRVNMLSTVGIPGYQVKCEILGHDSNNKAIWDNTPGKTDNVDGKGTAIAFEGTTGNPGIKGARASPINVEVAGGDITSIQTSSVTAIVTVSERYDNITVDKTIVKVGDTLTIQIPPTVAGDAGEGFLYVKSLKIGGINISAPDPDPDDAKVVRSISVTVPSGAESGHPIEFFATYLLAAGEDYYFTRFNLEIV